MQIQNTDTQTSVVTGITELIAANATQVRDEIRAALSPGCVCLDMDLSEVTFLDSSGLGALISLNKTLRLRRGVLRILKPAPNVRQLLDLTRLDHVFEIIN